MAFDIEPPSPPAESLVERLAGASAGEKAAELRAAQRPSIYRLFGRQADWSWRVGAAGERKVARELARLPRGRWVVLHDVPIGTRGANVDHLVIGPGGVFSLNAKNLKGRVWVAERTLLHNGYRTDYLPKSAREADRVSRLVSGALGRPILAHGVVVVMCDKFTVKKMPLDVTVVTRRQLVRWVLRMSTVLGPSDIAEIGRAAADPHTWTASARR